MIKDHPDESRLYRRYRFPEEGIPLQNRHHRGEEAGGMDCRGETSMSRLIDRKTFDIVQRKLKSRQRPRQTGEISLFAGLDQMRRVREVADYPLHQRRSIPKQIYSCKTYNAYGKQPLFPAPG